VGNLGELDVWGERELGEFAVEDSVVAGDEERGLGIGLGGKRGDSVS
jgi:hypothetical protein